MSQQQDFMNIVEAALLAAGRPLDMSELLALFEGESEAPDRKNLREIIGHLQDDWAERSLELVEVATGYRFQVRARYGRWMGRLWAERPPRYSRALLETLALIAYRQPVTRAEIEDVRGVSVSPTIIKTLMEREWIRVLGHRDVPGRPALFGTTKEFLDTFALKTLEDLPPLAEIRDIENLHADLFAGLEGLGSASLGGGPAGAVPSAPGAIPQLAVAGGEDGLRGAEEDTGSDASAAALQDDSTSAHDFRTDAPTHSGKTSSDTQPEPSHAASPQRGDSVP